MSSPVQKQAADEWLPPLPTAEQIPRVNRAERRFSSIEQCESTFGFELPDIVRALFKQPFIAQRSPEWYLARQEAITSSDFAASIGANPYQTRQALIKKKVSGSDEFKGNLATQHGVFFEDCALYEYETQTGFKTIDFGLMSHHKLYEHMPPGTNAKQWFTQVHLPDHPLHDFTWLKGSPDGVAVHPETREAVLLEIKCPVTDKGFRKQQIAAYYYPQVQLMMHLFNLKRCHFVQYQPKTSAFFNAQFDLLVIDRDDAWFERAKTEARHVWTLIKEQRANPDVNLLPLKFAPCRQIFPVCVYTPNKAEKTFKETPWRPGFMEPQFTGSSALEQPIVARPESDFAPADGADAVEAAEAAEAEFSIRVRANEVDFLPC